MTFRRRVTSVITGDTLLPLGIIAAVMSALVVGAMWLGSFTSNAAQVEKALNDHKIESAASFGEVRAKQDTYNKDLSDLKLEMSRMNGKMDAVLSSFQKTSR